MTSIVCIDDNKLVGEALGDRFALEPDFEWLAWIGEADGIVDRLTTLRPDLVLLDVDVPGLDSFALVETLATRVPNARVVMFTGYPIPLLRTRAVESGAWGIVSKSSAPNVIVSALRQVAAGQALALTDD